MKKHVCRKCGVEKPFSEYPKRFFSEGKLVPYQRHQPFCSSCDAKNQTDSIHKNHVNYIKARVRDMKNRCARSKLKISKNLDEAFILELFKTQNGRCAITNLPMTWGAEGLHSNSGERRGTNISIDRIDSNVGYELNNIRLVCDRVNKIKSSMDDIDLYFWTTIISEKMKEL